MKICSNPEVAISSKLCSFQYFQTSFVSQVSSIRDEHDWSRSNSVSGEQSWTDLRIPKTRNDRKTGKILDRDRLQKCQQNRALCVLIDPFSGWLFVSDCEALRETQQNLALEGKFDCRLKTVFPGIPASPTSAPYNVKSPARWQCLASNDLESQHILFR